MHDHTTPRHNRDGPRGTANMTVGWFVERGDSVVLFDRHGNVYNPEWVSIVTGSWGFTGEGMAKLPRPARYDGQNEVIRGDRVLIFFLDGHPRRPVVMGGVRGIKAVPFLPYNHAAGKANRLALRVQPLDAGGAVAGRVDVEVAHTDAGDVAIGVTSSLEVRAAADLDRTTPAGTRVRVDPDGLTVTGPTGSTDQVVLGRAFLTDLVAGLIEVQSALAVLSIPATNLAALVIQIQAALAAAPAGGAPYLSTVTRTE